MTSQSRQSYFDALAERDEALARVRALEEALKTAADDLDKAANQFEGIRQSQAVGHVPLVSANPGRFAAKAERARAVLHVDPEKEER
jgi:hypothetical protein